jgi:hypothetical protein
MADRPAGTHMQHARLIENEVRRVESKRAYAIAPAAPDSDHITDIA